MTHEESNESMLSVTGLRKAHAAKAMKWLRNRSIAVCYRAADKSINCFPVKGGPERTYRAMYEAVEATR
jgi:predicted transcriptional regulator